MTTTSLANGRGSRPWAWAALAALVLLWLAALAEVALRATPMAALVVGSVLVAAVARSAFWWAATTRRAWKRW